MTPEQQSRQQIDRQLSACGWTVQDFPQLNLLSSSGIAVREFPLKTGFADYLLYVDQKVVGVIEAKPEGYALGGVETQSDKYLHGLPSNVPHYKLPLPFSYQSTGVETRFTNHLDPQPRSRSLFSFHRPEELRRLAEMDVQVRGLLRDMPPLDADKLWQVQSVAIRNLEQSLAKNKPRALIQMATGSGKTFTAVNFCYRLIKFAKAKRILFLVDRNNLGKQTLNEFQQFLSPDMGRKFTDTYPVQHLKRNTIDPAAKVCITTIQRLFSMLKGDDDYAEANEDDSLFESPPADDVSPVSVAYNPAVPIETFDFIVIDECHRSIYGLWRSVLDYFDAFLIGLTATPTKATFGFFQSNLVQDYDHTKAVIDGVNVGYDVFRIETEITAKGATLLKSAGPYVPVRDRRSGKKSLTQLDDDLPYTGKQLDRDIINDSQLRLVIQTFRDRLPEIFPGRTEVPKTLIFAKTDQHADRVVDIVREEFDRSNDFCRKITSKSHKPDELLNQFRNSYDPRIAVTVDMIATGTDVKPLECLVFLRDVRSLAYFEQMKGRGCRVISSDSLRSVTSDAHEKTHFVIVDAVGVCTSPKSASKPLDRKPTASLESLLKSVSMGVHDADTVSSLAAKLSRLNLKATDDDHAAISQHSGGASLETLCHQLRAAIDDDELDRAARQTYALPDETEPTDEQLAAVEQERCQSALLPLASAELRNTILTIQQRLWEYHDEQNLDRLRFVGFDPQAKDQAQSLITNFRQFIEDHKDEIEALQILYSRPHHAGLRYGQVKELAQAIRQPPHSLHPERLWHAFETVEPDKVQGHGGKQLVDVIALVRHALHPESPLAPIGITVEERYRQWLADQAAAGAHFTPDQQKWLDAIKDHIATSLTIEQDDLDDVPFNQIGGLGRAYELFGEKLATLLSELNEKLAA